MIDKQKGSYIMYRVLKRDGGIADFTISKISDAIKQAFEACDRQFNDNIIDFLALKVTSDFEPKIKDGLIAVEVFPRLTQTYYPRGL